MICHLVKMEEIRSALKILIGKPTEKKPLGRLMHSWEVNVRMDPEEIGVNMRNWIDSAHDMDYWRVIVNGALNLHKHVVIHHHQRLQKIRS